VVQEVASLRRRLEDLALLELGELVGDETFQLRAGRVVINGMTDDPQAPWGGFKYCRPRIWPVRD